MSDTEAFINEKRALQMKEPLKVGDKVHYDSDWNFAGDGRITEILYKVAIDKGLYITNASRLTKIKPKVNRYKWIFRGKLSGFISLSSEYYTKEECERAFPGCKILYAVTETERIDDE